jgi:hypothetical protein
MPKYVKDLAEVQEQVRIQGPVCCPAANGAAQPQSMYFQQ